MRLGINVSRMFVMSIFLSGLWSSSAVAVVIAPQNDAPNIVAPADNPYWSNLAYTSRATSVYLGDRWMLTANHVTLGSVRFTDGRTFDLSVGSSTAISNPSGFAGSPDLKMFRLAADPGLGSLPIDAIAPLAGTRVMMAGSGTDRAQKEVFWNAPSTGNWTSVSPVFSQERGFALVDSSVMRWGMNTVESTGIFDNQGTVAFSSRFDQFGLPFEAQATSGDSGGGVFRFVDGGWKLTGIMIDGIGVTNQPSGTVVFGDQSLMAELAMYRDQIQAVLNRDEPLWQNQVNHFDVNHSGNVNALDALRVINEIARSGPHVLLGAPPSDTMSWDANGDGLVDGLDLLQIINALHNNTANPAAASSLAQPNLFATPEPSTVVLALWGALGWTLTHLAMRRKRSRLAGPPMLSS